MLLNRHKCDSLAHFDMSSMSSTTERSRSLVELEDITTDGGEGKKLRKDQARDDRLTRRRRSQVYFFLTVNAKCAGSTEVDRYHRNLSFHLRNILLVTLR